MQALELLLVMCNVQNCAFMNRCQFNLSILVLAEPESVRVVVKSTSSSVIFRLFSFLFETLSQYCLGIYLFCSTFFLPGSSVCLHKTEEYLLHCLFKSYS